MTIRRRVDELDEDGRRKTTVIEEPAATHDPLRDVEVIGEEEVVATHPRARDVARSWVRTVGLWVVFALGVVETLLGFRLGFGLVGANRNNNFVDFIYDLTGPMVGPFEGIASVRAIRGDGVFEPETLIAMLVFSVAAGLLVAMLWVMSAFPSPGERSAVTRTQRRERAVHDHH